MSPGLIGALIGFIVGLMGYFAIRFVAHRVEAQGVGADPGKTAALLRFVALADLVFFIIAGYFIGPMIIENAG